MGSRFNLCIVIAVLLLTIPSIQAEGTRNCQPLFINGIERSDPLPYRLTRVREVVIEKREEIETKIDDILKSYALRMKIFDAYLMLYTRKGINEKALRTKINEFRSLADIAKLQSYLVRLQKKIDSFSSLHPQAIPEEIHSLRDAIFLPYITALEDFSKKCASYSDKEFVEQLKIIHLTYNQNGNRKIGLITTVDYLENKIQERDKAEALIKAKTEKTALLRFIKEKTHELEKPPEPEKPLELISPRNQRMIRIREGLEKLVRSKKISRQYVEDFIHSAAGYTHEYLEKLEKTITKALEETEEAD